MLFKLNLEIIKNIAGKKQTTFVLVLLCFLFLAASGSELYLLQKARTKEKNLKAKLVSLGAKATQLRRKVKESEKLVFEMKTQLKKEKERLMKLEQKLELERQAKLKIFTQFMHLNTKLKQEKDDLEKTKSSLAKAQNDLESLKAKFKSVWEEKERLKLKLQKLNVSKVSLGSVVVENSHNLAEQTLAGRVIAVVKEYNFCVIDIGSLNGVKEGDLFSLYRHKRYLGEIKIDKVKNSLAAGEFLTPSLRNTLRKGDRAIYNQPQTKIHSR